MEVMKSLRSIIPIPISFEIQCLPPLLIPVTNSSISVWVDIMKSGEVSSTQLQGGIKYFASWQHTAFINYFVQDSANCGILNGPQLASNATECVFGSLKSACKGYILVVGS